MHTARRSQSKTRNRSSIPTPHFFSVFLASATHMSAHRIPNISTPQDHPKHSTKLGFGEHSPAACLARIIAAVSSFALANSVPVSYARQSNRTPTAHRCRSNVRCFPSSAHTRQHPTYTRCGVPRPISQPPARTSEQTYLPRLLLEVLLAGFLALVAAGHGVDLSADGYAVGQMVRYAAERVCRAV